jgi:hypothetical protein
MVAQKWLPLNKKYFEFVQFWLYLRELFLGQSVADLGGGRGGATAPPNFFLGGRRPPKNFEKKVKTH